VVLASAAFHRVDELAAAATITLNPVDGDRLVTRQ